jgi:NADPH-dependent F420 reductase
MLAASPKHPTWQQREYKVRIGILGTGGVGGVLGIKWAHAGHHVLFGSRTPLSERCEALAIKAGPNAKVATLAGAAEHSEALVIAVPWGAVEETLALAGPLAGKVVIDCSNPLKPDLSGLATGASSAAEEIATLLPRACVVKAFNTASTKVMLDPAFPAGPATMFFCGDDPDAKLLVKELIAQIGFEPVDAGPLHHARYLESLAMLYIHLAIRGGWGSNCAFQMVKR